MMLVRLLAAWCVLGGVVLAQDAAFRTDANPDEKLPWFQIVPGEFPPQGSWHEFAGELIEMDHVNRTGTLRIDRTDAQRRSHWDLPVDFTMLPYGAIYYHGAPAALRNIPIGTHLHGKFYIKGPDEEGTRPVFFGRASLEKDFTKCFELADDFSYHSATNRAWRIESVDTSAGTITVLGISTDTDETDDKPTTFHIVPATRVWQGKGFAELADLAPGQIVQVNLTWATLFGPGRCTDIWIDEASRELATKRQLAVHHQHQRERGLAGWVDAVDNPNRIVSVTLFGSVDPALLEAFQPNTSVTMVVAEPSLRSYDQVNDRKGGPLVDVKTVDREPGSSGIQIQVKPDLLLEGFRPGRIVRVFPSGWPVGDIPLEERLWPERD
jgi:hypothetical protein